MLSDQFVVTLGFAGVITTANVIGKGDGHDTTVRAKMAYQHSLF